MWVYTLIGLPLECACFASLSSGSPQFQRSLRQIYHRLWRFPIFQRDSRCLPFLVCFLFFLFLSLSFSFSLLIHTTRTYLSITQNNTHEHAHKMGNKNLFSDNKYWNRLNCAILYVYYFNFLLFTKNGIFFFFFLFIYKTQHALFVLNSVR